MNKLWQELFLELKILHTNTTPNMIERCYRTIVSILKTMGREMQEEWDLGVKAACLAYITTVHTGIGQTQFFATFGREARAGHVPTFLKSFRCALERGPSDKSFRFLSIFVVSFRYVPFCPVPFCSE